MKLSIRGLIMLMALATVVQSQCPPTALDGFCANKLQTRSIVNNGTSFPESSGSCNFEETLCGYEQGCYDLPGMLWTPKSDFVEVKGQSGCSNWYSVLQSPFLIIPETFCLKFVITQAQPSQLHVFLINSSLYANVIFKPNSVPDATFIEYSFTLPATSSRIQFRAYNGGSDTGFVRLISVSIVLGSCTPLDGFIGPSSVTGRWTTLNRTFTLNSEEDEAILNKTQSGELESLLIQPTNSMQVCFSFQYSINSKSSTLNVYTKSLQGNSSFHWSLKSNGSQSSQWHDAKVPLTSTVPFKIGFKGVLCDYSTKTSFIKIRSFKYKTDECQITPMSANEYVNEHHVCDIDEVSNSFQRLASSAVGPASSLVSTVFINLFIIMMFSTDFRYPSGMTLMVLLLLASLDQYNCLALSDVDRICFNNAVSNLSAQKESYGNCKFESTLCNYTQRCFDKGDMQWKRTYDFDEAKGHNGCCELVSPLLKIPETFCLKFSLRETVPFPLSVFLVNSTAITKLYEQTSSIISSKTEPSFTLQATSAIIMFQASNNGGESRHVGLESVSIVLGSCNPLDCFHKLRQDHCGWINYNWTVTKETEDFKASMSNITQYASMKSELIQATNSKTHCLYFQYKISGKMSMLTVYLEPLRSNQQTLLKLVSNGSTSLMWQNASVPINSTAAFKIELQGFINCVSHDAEVVIHAVKYRKTNCVATPTPVNESYDEIDCDKIPLAGGNMHYGNSANVSSLAISSISVVVIVIIIAVIIGVLMWCKRRNSHHKDISDFKLCLPGCLSNIAAGVCNRKQDESENGEYCEILNVHHETLIQFPKESSEASLNGDRTANLANNKYCDNISTTCEDAKHTISKKASKEPDIHIYNELNFHGVQVKLNQPRKQDPVYNKLEEV